MDEEEIVDLLYERYGGLIATSDFNVEDGLTILRISITKQIPDLAALETPNLFLVADFFAGIWCFITDSAKSEGYQRAIRDLRKNFDGIARDNLLQRRFANIISPNLYVDNDVRRVYKRFDQVGHLNDYFNQ